MRGRSGGTDGVNKRGVTFVFTEILEGVDRSHEIAPCDIDSQGAWH